MNRDSNLNDDDDLSNSMIIENITNSIIMRMDENKIEEEGNNNVDLCNEDAEFDLKQTNCSNKTDSNEDEDYEILNKNGKNENF